MSFLRKHGAPLCPRSKKGTQRHNQSINLRGGRRLSGTQFTRQARRRYTRSATNHHTGAIRLTISTSPRSTHNNMSTKIARGTH